MANEQTEKVPNTEEPTDGSAPPAPTTRRPVIKKRTSRKHRQEELEQPDEFMEVGGTMIDWLIEHGKPVGICIGATFLILAVWASVDTLDGQKQEEASAALFDARADMPRQTNQQIAGVSLALSSPDDDEGLQKTLDAVAALDTVIANHGSTPQAHQARMVAGNALYDRGEVEQALPYFDAARDAHGLVGLRAANAHAHALLDLGRHDEAAATFEALRSRTELSMKQAATLDLARVHEAAGQSEKALLVYNQFLAEFPDSDQTQQVQARIAAHAAP